MRRFARIWAATDPTHVKIMRRTGSVIEFPGSTPVNQGKLLELECDLLVPAALGGVEGDPLPVGHQSLESVASHRRDSEVADEFEEFAQLAGAAVILSTHVVETVEAVADRVAMMQYAWFSVISPEGCSSILWKSGESADKAAQALKLTAKENLRLGIVDTVIDEPLGGAQRRPSLAADAVEKAGMRVAMLDRNTASAANAAHYARIVRFNSVLRQLVRAGTYVVHLQVVDRTNGDKIVKTAPVVVATRLN